MRCLTLLSLAVFGAFLVRASQDDHLRFQNNDQGGVARNDVENTVAEAAATNVLFHRVTSDSVEVLSVELEFTALGMRRIRADQQQNGSSIKEEVIKTTDPHLLELGKYAFEIQRCFRPFPIPDGDASWKGGDLGMPYAVLRFQTTHETRTIGLSRYGFSLSANEASNRYGFFSATGADFVNLLYIKKHLYPLPGYLIDGLSGHLQLRETSDGFHARREDTTSEKVN